LRSDLQSVYDQLLEVRCRRGDRRAWQELIDRWEMPLFYYLRRLVRRESDAWDVLQQTWLAAYQGIESLKDPATFVVWLHRIARNLAASHHRGLRRELATVEDGPESPDHADPGEDPPDVQAEAFDDARQMHRAMDELSVPHREVLTLHFLQGLSIAQIAAVVDASEGTVKSRLHYAKRALRTLIEQEQHVHRQRSRQHGEGRP
jgi:RNA polymerase sigma-70 factor (ECF subfamily)